MTSLITLTYSLARAKLESQQDQKTIEMLKGIFPEASFYSLEDELYIIYDNSRYEIGYAFYAKGRGFSEIITVLVGLQDKETIKSIAVISHNEHLGGYGEIAGPPLDFSPSLKNLSG